MSGHRVIFKHEDEVDGEPVGPVVVYSLADLRVDADDDGKIGRPYDPNEVPRWVTRAEALAVAAELDVELEES
jgi:hypothetical protein